MSGLAFMYLASVAVPPAVKFARRKLQERSARAARYEKLKNIVEEIANKDAIDGECFRPIDLKVKK